MNTQERLAEKLNRLMDLSKTPYEKALTEVLAELSSMTCQAAGYGPFMPTQLTPKPKWTGSSANPKEE